MKKKHLLLTLLLIIISNIMKAQVTFQKTYGSTNNDCGNYIQQTNDGGFIIVGYTEDDTPGVNSDVYLIKINAKGIIQWSKIYGDSNNEYGYCVQQTTDGGYIICGDQILSSNNNRGFLIKTDPNGDTVWTRIFGNSNSGLYSVIQTNDGGYVAAGYTKSGSIYPAYLVKVDNNGNLLWGKEYIPNSNQSALLVSVIQTSDGGYISCGTNSSLNSTYLLKVNGAGDTLYSKSILGLLANTIKKTNDGGYIIGGAYSNVPTIYGSVIKIDANGNPIWNHTFGNDLIVKSVQQTNNGEYIAVLIPRSVISSSYIIKLSTTGNFIWGKEYHPTQSGLAQCMQITADNGYITVGQYSEINTNVYLIKSDSNGISGCNESNYLMSQINIANTSSNIINSITNNSSSYAMSLYVNSVSSDTTTLCYSDPASTSISKSSVTANNIMIYPNPVQDILSVLTQPDTKATSIKIYNIYGALVRQTLINKDVTTISLSNLTDGLYLFQITDNSNNILDFGKILKEK